MQATPDTAAASGHERRQRMTVDEQLTISVDRVAGTVVVTLTGEMDLAVEEQIRDAVAAAVFHRDRSDACRRQRDQVPRCVRCAQPPPGPPDSRGSRTFLHPRNVFPGSGLSNPFVVRSGRMVRRQPFRDRCRLTSASLATIG
jgi:hypothetical protein